MNNDSNDSNRVMPNTIVTSKSNSLNFLKIILTVFLQQKTQNLILLIFLKIMMTMVLQQKMQ